MSRPRRAALSSEELARAARLLAVRSRREATGLFSGNYASAFRGGGLEFEESRPYCPGDDVRGIDWNATARTGVPYVKTFREERDQTLFFALDVSASMRFGSTGRAKAATAAHALALMASAAARAGDRCGLVAFDAAPRAQIPIGRGLPHTWRLIREALSAAERSRGETRLVAGLRSVPAHMRHRAVVILLSDLRDPEMFPPEPAPARLRRELASLTRLHDVVAAVVVDPREQALPRAGPVRVEDPERPGAVRLLDTGSRRVRERYAAAAGAWRRRVEVELRRAGVDAVWLRTDRSPLYALGRFFLERSGRRLRVAA